MIVFVSGFQRCGSSLVMQMLDAGGMPVVHSPGMGYPSFESDLNINGGSLDAYDQHAMKWLEPQRAMPGCVPFEVRVLWLTRQHLQQARSAVKFLRAMTGLKGSVSRFRRSYDRDEAWCLHMWRERGLVLTLSFERLITDSRAAADGISRFVGRDLDINAMVSQVRPRDTDCLPYLLEYELIESQRR